MDIQSRCRRQRPLADRMFMDFKYTPAASAEQHAALARLHQLLLEWLLDGDGHLGCKEASNLGEVLLTVCGEL